MQTVIDSLKQRINELHLEHRDLDDVIARLGETATAAPQEEKASVERSDLAPGTSAHARHPGLVHKSRLQLQRLFVAGSAASALAGDHRNSHRKHAQQHEPRERPLGDREGQKSPPHFRAFARAAENFLERLHEWKPVEHVFQSRAAFRHLAFRQMLGQGRVPPNIRAVLDWRRK